MWCFSPHVSMSLHAPLFLASLPFCCLYKSVYGPTPSPPAALPSASLEGHQEPWCPESLVSKFQPQVQLMCYRTCNVPLNPKVNSLSYSVIGFPFSNHPCDISDCITISPQPANFKISSLPIHLFLPLLPLPLRQIHKMLSKTKAHKFSLCNLQLIHF